MKNQLIFSPIPESTERSECDFSYIIEINQWLLMSIGIWPTQSEGHIIKKILQKLIIICCYFLIFFLLIPCAFHAFLMERDLRKKLKMVGPMTFFIMAISKYGFLISKGDKIRKCLDHIDIDCRRAKSLEDREIIMNNAKVGRFIASLCAIIMYSGALFFRLLLPFAGPRKILPDNTTLRPLAFPVYRPLLNTQNTPNYEIVFAIQLFGGVVVYTIAVAACSLVTTFALHACSQLKIVMIRLEKFVESNLETTETLTGKLGEIVELHLRILRFVMQVEELLNEICFVEFIGCSVNICIVGYYFIAEDKLPTVAIITYTFLLTSFTFSIFIYCHAGELLNQQGKKVGTTAYMMNWHKLPGNSAKGLLLLLAISNNPKTITAGKMVTLSYATFSNVLKSAVAYFNLIRTMIA